MRNERGLWQRATVRRWRVRRTRVTARAAVVRNAGCMERYR